MREITPLLQIRQVAHLVEHHMQPARAPRAKEHTNNPVQASKNGGIHSFRRGAPNRRQVQLIWHAIPRVDTFRTRIVGIAYIAYGIL